ncbi:hypothetical protein HK102_007634, partial [Quaeritorhiza haematococci]
HHQHHQFGRLTDPHRRIRVMPHAGYQTPLWYPVPPLLSTAHRRRAFLERLC